MSPKTVMSVAVLLLSLTSLTLSSAVHSDCSGFDSVPDILNHYDLPSGLFPNDVQHFSCHPVNRNAHRLSIRLHGVCKVTREVFFVRNTVVCQPEISAIISPGQLVNIKGVTVTLSFLGKPIGELMTVTRAKVFQIGFAGKWLQFFSDKGDSPLFPVPLFQEPTYCDRSADPAVDHSAVVAAQDNQDVPLWVSKYGRLLPFVAA